MKSTGKIFAGITALCAAFSLSGCKVDENVPENVTAVPTETTSLTLTVALTEEKPFVPAPEEDETQRIELAVFDPFSDSVKVEDNVYEELRQAVIEISDANAFFGANFTGFPTSSEYYMTYADINNILEENKEEEYSFAPLNPEYASTEEELFERFRRIYTENYISDEEIRGNLFTPENYDNQPLYKTIDGVLCMKCSYKGISTRIHTDEIFILSYDENTAQVAAYGSSIADPPPHIYIDLKKSPDGIWQLDEIDYRENDSFTINLLYNAVYLNTEKLNKILSGGTVPEDPETIEINRNSYIETELDMGIGDMYDYFGEIFFEYKLKYNGATENHRNGLLLDEYRREFIDEVYYEQNGKLFRRADAPVRYLPGIEINPYISYGEYMGVSGDMELFGGDGGFFTLGQKFIDENGESIIEDISICYKFSEDYTGYEYFRIASELPILERTK